MAVSKQRKTLGIFCVSVLIISLLYFNQHYVITSVTYSRVKTAKNQLENGWLLAVNYKDKSDPINDEGDQNKNMEVKHIEDNDSTSHNMIFADISDVSRESLEHLPVTKPDTVNDRTEEAGRSGSNIPTVPMEFHLERTVVHVPPLVTKKYVAIEYPLFLSPPNKDTNNTVTSLQKETSSNNNPPLTPCINVSKRLGLKGNEAWNKFKQSLERYATFHKDQLERLKHGGKDSHVTTLTYTCNDPSSCSGLGDQFYKIQQAFLLAVAFNRVLVLHWDPLSMKTFSHIIPNRIQWNYFNSTSGMHLKPEPELTKLTNKEHFTHMMNVLGNKDRQHVTISYALPVPFGKGMAQILKSDKHGVFSKLSWYAMHVGDRNGVSKSILCGTLLRYLFTFSQQVLEKVEEAQKLIGIFNTPYVGVHIRTGFFGTKYQEIGRFNKMKIFRTEDKWLNTMNCSIKLASKLLNQEALVYLATDSYMVKADAARGHGARIRSINMTLQHVALLKENNPKNHKMSLTNSNSESTQTGQGVSTLSGVDGYMATWVDFLLLARANVLVHSISGFSTIAGQFCSVPRQFYTPRCTVRPAP